MTLEALTRMYRETIQPLTARDRLQLARWILDDIPAPAVVDDSDDWNEEDMRDATRYSLRRVAALFEEDTEDAQSR